MTRTTDPTALKIAAMTGLGYHQVWRLARKGCIPCTIIGRRIVMTPGQWEQLDREGVKPEPKDEAPAKPKQPTFLHTRKAS